MRRWKLLQSIREKKKIKKEMTSSNKNNRKGFKNRMLLVPAGVLAFCCVIFLLIHAHVRNAWKDRIMDAEAVMELADFKPDCILILGAGVTDEGEPMPMLTERLNTGLKLYEAGAAPKIIVSGDHGRKDYDEVNVMKDWLKERGVPSEDIFMDHAGFSTYESMYRMRDVFMVESMIVVTQRYHLYRALYNANSLGVEAYGVPCDAAAYSGQTYREAREMVARVKDYFYCAFDVKPKYLGEAIPVSGSGDATNDRQE